MEFLCLDFINSSWYITHKSFADPLEDNGWLAILAVKYDMRPLPAPSEKELEGLIDMRYQLSKLFYKIIDGDQFTEADFGILNNYMRAAGYHREIHCRDGACRLYEIPQLQNWSWFMAEVAVSFSRLITSEAVNNLKTCQNPGCKWFFIDESKSRNRKWCDETCATLMKVRRFRQKDKKTQ